jgi:hypothetical protein
MAIVFSFFIVSAVFGRVIVHTILEIRLDLVGIDARRHRERA